jgi:hypothetical protein
LDGGGVSVSMQRELKRVIESQRKVDFLDALQVTSV